MQLQILKNMVLHEVRQIRGFFKHSNDSESATDMTSWLLKNSHRISISSHKRKYIKSKYFLLKQKILAFFC